MNESKISVRYAKALFSLVKEDNSPDIHKMDMELLLQCIHEIPELQFVIESPVIKPSEKYRLFMASFKETFSPLSISFIKLVLDHRREEYLAGICRHFLTLLKTDQGIRTASLVTATQLDETLRQSIIRLVSRQFGAKVELHETVDKQILGGFILRVDDQQFDASIVSKLNRIKTELINSHS